jgi:hypothetical protein
MESHEAYEKAKRRVEAKIGFYIHVAVYAGVNLLLLIINLTTSPRHLWFKWPLIGWGIGLLFHGIGISLHSRGLAFKEKMIERELKKEVNREIR